jgi:putative tryptophan/tyrosine transport system substrate-binding protein
MAIHIGRREFITLLGGAAAAPSMFWPRSASAEQAPMQVIGFLSSASPQSYAHVVAAFRQGLKEVGYVEGQNIAIEYRWAEGQYDRLPVLAAELVSRKVAVIITPFSPDATHAAKAATTTIPIIFTTGLDPVQTNFVTSLNRPGGNVTGLTALNSELGPKQLGLLHQLIPGATRFAVLVDATPRDSTIANLQAAASSLGKEIEVLRAGTIDEIDAAFASLVQKRADALLVITSVLFFNRRTQLVTLAARHAVPAIYWTRDFTEASGLMSYGSDVTDQLRQAGIYTGRILKGEKPADLSVMRATKFEFVINLQTAKTLGLIIPSGLLAIADEVIE